MENKIIEKNYNEGKIEVEGNEDFVSKELDKFLEAQNE